MASQSPDQLAAPEASMPNRAPIINIQSLPYDYLRYCVKFAQDNGFYPDNLASQPDANVLNEDSCSDDHSRSVPNSLDFTSNRGDPRSNKSNSQSSGPADGSTYVDPRSLEHSYDPDHSPNSSMELTEDDLSLAQYDSEVSFSHDHDMDIDTDNLPVPPNTPHSQASNLPTNDATTASPEETLPPPHQSSTSEEPSVKAIAFLNNYDPLWVQHAGVELDSVFKSYSKMKFEQLFIDGVIQKGDRLVVNYNTAFSLAFDKEKHFATLTVRAPEPLTLILDLPSLTDISTLTSAKQHTGFSKPAPHLKLPARFYPDLVLTLSSHPTHTSAITACSGMQAILKAFNKIDVSGPDMASNMSTALNVWRGNQDLGTFLYVRQAYHAWRIKMDAENPTWRPRKGNVRKVVAVRARGGKGRGSGKTRGGGTT